MTHIHPTDNGCGYNMIIMTCNGIDDKHLANVTKEMQTLGAPSIRAIYDGEMYYALEGSHRLLAAKNLGLIPNIIEVDYNDDIITLQVDGKDTGVVASEYIDRLLLVGERDDRHIIYFEAV